MPQPTGYGDDDGDDNGVDGDVENDYYYYISWDEKKKGWEHQLPQHHYYCEKNRIIGPIDPAGRGKSVII